MILFLDDERNPEDVTWLLLPKNQPFIIARNREDFETALVSFTYTEIFLDHDLADKDFTGYDAVKILVDLLFDGFFGKNIPNVVVHSQNPIGASNIRCLWTNALREAMK